MTAPSTSPVTVIPVLPSAGEDTDTLDTARRVKKCGGLAYDHGYLPKIVAVHSLGRKPSATSTHPDSRECPSLRAVVSSNGNEHQRRNPPPYTVTTPNSAASSVVNSAPKPSVSFSSNQTLSQNETSERNMQIPWFTPMAATHVEHQSGTVSCTLGQLHFQDKDIKIEPTEPESMSASLPVVQSVCSVPSVSGQKAVPVIQGVHSVGNGSIASGVFKAVGCENNLHSRSFCETTAANPVISPATNSERERNDFSIHRLLYGTGSSEDAANARGLSRPDVFSTARTEANTVSQLQHGVNSLDTSPSDSGTHLTQGRSFREHQPSENKMHSPESQINNEESPPNAMEQNNASFTIRKILSNNREANERTQVHMSSSEGMMEVSWEGTWDILKGGYPISLATGVEDNAKLHERALIKRNEIKQILCQMVELKGQAMVKKNGEFRKGTLPSPVTAILKRLGQLSKERTDNEKAIWNLSRDYDSYKKFLQNSSRPSKPAVKKPLHSYKLKALKRLDEARQNRVASRMTLLTEEEALHSQLKGLLKQCLDELNEQRGKLKDGLDYLRASQKASVRVASTPPVVPSSSQCSDNSFLLSPNEVATVMNAYPPIQVTDVRSLSSFNSASEDSLKGDGATHERTPNVSTESTSRTTQEKRAPVINFDSAIEKLRRIVKRSNNPLEPRNTDGTPKSSDSRSTSTANPSQKRKSLENLTLPVQETPHSMICGDDGHTTSSCKRARKSKPRRLSLERMRANAGESEPRNGCENEGKNESAVCDNPGDGSGMEQEDSGYQTIESPVLCNTVTSASLRVPFIKEEKEDREYTVSQAQESIELPFSYMTATPASFQAPVIKKEMEDTGYIDSQAQVGTTRNEIFEVINPPNVELPVETSVGIGSYGSVTGVELRDMYTGNYTWLYCNNDSTKDKTLADQAEEAFAMEVFGLGSDKTFPAPPPNIPYDAVTTIFVQTPEQETFSVKTSFDKVRDQRIQSLLKKQNELLSRLDKTDSWAYQQRI